MNPLIRIRLAQLLARKYQLEPVKAVDLAEELSELLATGHLDIVLDTWVKEVGHEGAAAQAGRRKEFWDELSERIERIDERYGDWHPWRP